MNGPSIEQPPSAEVQLENDVYRRLRLDYRLGFQFGQNDTALHFDIHRGVAEVYRRTLTAEEKEALPDALMLLQGGYRNVHPPAGHGGIDEFDRIRNLDNEFKAFREQLLLPGFEFPELITYERLITSIGRGLLERDLHYLRTGGRPNRQPGQDKFESFFRKYVLLGDSTKSAAYDLIFATIRSEYRDALATRPEAMSELWTDVVWYWEQKHQHSGESFCPPELLPPANEPKSLKRLSGYLASLLRRHK